MLRITKNKLKFVGSMMLQKKKKKDGELGEVVVAEEEEDVEEKENEGENEGEKEEVEEKKNEGEKEKENEEEKEEETEEKEEVVVVVVEKNGSSSLSSPSLRVPTMDVLMQSRGGMTSVEMTEMTSEDIVVDVNMALIEKKEEEEEKEKEKMENEKEEEEEKEEEKEEQDNEGKAEKKEEKEEKQNTAAEKKENKTRKQRMLEHAVSSDTDMLIGGAVADHLNARLKDNRNVLNEIVRILLRASIDQHPNQRDGAALDFLLRVDRDNRVAFVRSARRTWYVYTFLSKKILSCLLIYCHSFVVLSCLLFFLFFFFVSFSFSSQVCFLRPG